MGSINMQGGSASNRPVAPSGGLANIGEQSSAPGTGARLVWPVNRQISKVVIEVIEGHFAFNTLQLVTGGKTKVEGVTARYSPGQRYEYTLPSPQQVGEINATIGEHSMQVRLRLYVVVPVSGSQASPGHGGGYSVGSEQDYHPHSNVRDDAPRTIQITVVDGHVSSAFEGRRWCKDASMVLNIGEPMDLEMQCGPVTVPITGAYYDGFTVDLGTQRKAQVNPQVRRQVQDIGHGRDKGMNGVDGLKVKIDWWGR